MGYGVLNELINSLGDEETLWVPERLIKEREGRERKKRRGGEGEEKCIEEGKEKKSSS